MGCMKCGKETRQDQIFCDECLEEMEKYPVKPGIVVQIPTRPQKKQVHHRRVTVTHDEQIKRLTTLVRRLTLAIVLTTAAAILFALLTFDVLEKSSMQKLLGQNYSVADEATEGEERPERFFDGLVDWFN